MTSEFNIPPAFACYRLGKAEAYLRKAQAELENLELINEKVLSDLHGLMSFCRENAYYAREDLKKEMESVNG
jgi:hypothetical protein